MSKFYFTFQICDSITQWHKSAFILCSWIYYFHQQYTILKLEAFMPLTLCNLCIKILSERHLAGRVSLYMYDFQNQIFVIIVFSVYYAKYVILCLI